MASVMSAFDLLVDRPADLGRRDAKTSCLRHQLADETPRFGRPVPGLSIGPDFLDERSGSMTSAHQSVRFEIAIRLDDRRRVDAKASRERSHRRERLAPL